jgi:predicted anti-sigma-YlaC factor YlaD
VVRDTGNRIAPACDYSGVDCQNAREAISALLDDEGSDVPGWVLDEHLDSCADCRRWESAAHAVTRTARLRPLRPASGGSDAVVAAVLARSRPPRRPTSLTFARLGLVAVGIVQAAITLPELLFGRDHAAPVHVAHEMGAFAMALAAGFLIAAWKPDRARGMHALVGVAAALLVVTAALDLLHGRTDIGDEAPHLLAIIGWLLLGRLAAATPSPAADPAWSRLPVNRSAIGRRAPSGIGATDPRPQATEAGDRRAG